MNTTASDGLKLIQEVINATQDNTVDIAVYPPFVYLREIASKCAGTASIILGAQDCWHESNGAYTGEISTQMLKDCDVSSVLTGHSERRHVIGESDELVNLKTKSAIADGLLAVLCVGETLEQRESGQTDAVNETQIRAGLKDIEKGLLGLIVIAYEPVWAIGTGKTATPEDAQNAHAKIRELIASMYDQQAADAMRIIYGGSMKPGNANELMAMPDIDGGLIGGAALKADDFHAIIAAGAAQTA